MTLACGRTFAFINRSPDKTFSLNLLLPAGRSSTSKRAEYHLTATNRSDVFDRHVSLNGRPLRMEGWAQLPSLTPTMVSLSDSLNLPANYAVPTLPRGPYVKTSLL